MKKNNSKADKGTMKPASNLPKKHQYPSSASDVINYFSAEADSIKFLLPILQTDINYSSEDEIIERILNYFSLEMFSKKIDKHLLTDISKHRNDAIQHIKETIQILQKMILIATVEDFLTEDEMEEFSKKTLLPSLKTDKHTTYLDWLGKHLTFFEVDLNFPKPKTWQDALSFSFRSDAIVCIARAYSYDLSLGYSKASKFFAGCPTCQRIFEKTRANQEFCSVKCGNLARDRKRREKRQSRD